MPRSLDPTLPVGVAVGVGVGVAVLAGQAKREERVFSALPAVA